MPKKILALDATQLKVVAAMSACLTINLIDLLRAKAVLDDQDCIAYIASIERASVGNASQDAALHAMAQIIRLALQRPEGHNS